MELAEPTEERNWPKSTLNSIDAEALNRCPAPTIRLGEVSRVWPPPRSAEFHQSFY